MEEKVYPLLEELKNADEIKINDEKQSQALLEFLMMVETGYLLNEQEKDYLGKIIEWRVYEADRLPESISKLTNLIELDISYTQIGENELSCLSELKKLRRIGLRGLILHHIPKELIELNLPFDFDNEYFMNSDGIYLKNTTLTAQPISLFVQSRKLIEAYYAEEKVRISEAKVIFLGYGGVGKTYTIKRILNSGRQGDYETKATPGIDILSYTTEYSNQKIDICLWDFGGQEIMHAMHRCFLTERTCYVVVVDNRKENLTEQAENWLHDIHTFAPNCPVILAVNQIDGVVCSGVNAPKLKKTFANLVGDPIYYSAKTDTEAEFRRLTDAIYKQASKLDSYGMEFPASWTAIRKQIEECSKEMYYLNNDEYNAICEKHGLEDSNIRKWLLAWFNDLGVCFSYHFDDRQKGIKNYKLLNPKWITNALYIIINTCQELSVHGLLLHKIIDFQLNERNTDKKLRVFERFVEYSIEERNYILGIMRKFLLSYQVTENTEFIPALCVNAMPDEVEPTTYEKKVTYKIKYNYLPDTVVHRLMILCYEQLNLKKTWNKGFRMDVTIDNIIAVVEMKNSTTLQIDVYSLVENERTWEVLSYLCGHIMSINRDLNVKTSDYVIVEDTTLDRIRHACISIDFLLNAKIEKINSLYIEAVEDCSVMEVQVDKVLETIFGEETLSKAEEKASEQGRTIEQELLMRIATSILETKKMRKIVLRPAVLAAKVDWTVKSCLNSEEELCILETKNEEIMQYMEERIELANSLIQTLATHQDAEVRQLAMEMQQTLTQKKSPWKKLREYIEKGANLLTIISAIAPYVNRLLLIPEIQVLPEQILIAMRTIGNL